MTVNVNYGCGPHYAEGWINVDVHQGDGVSPDIVVDPGEYGLPFIEKGTVDRLYLGHVLEHIPLDSLTGRIYYLSTWLAPGGEILIVGPDCRRALEQFKHDRIDETQLWAILEDGTAHMSGEQWTGARHLWNCTEARVLELCAAAGLEARARDLNNAVAFIDWPVVSFIDWQFAVSARIPEATYKEPTK